MIGYVLVWLFIFLFVLSFFKIRHGKLTAEFIYGWGFPFGSFVWEDLLIFSLYGILSTVIALLSHQTKIGILFFIIFWIVRSAGETLYYFLQQFIEPKHFPHDIESQLSFFTGIFGPISFQQRLIIAQVFCQIILMVSLTSLVFLLLSWSTLS